jgi:hypothetical protein
MTDDERDKIIALTKLLESANEMHRLGLIRAQGIQDILADGIAVIRMLEREHPIEDKP